MRHRHKFHAIIPGVDLQALEPFAGQRELRVSSNNGPFVILQVGTICDRKNQVLLIRALGELAQSFPVQDFRVWLAGDVFDEAYAEELRKLVCTLGLESVVQFLGWRTDVHELMAKADVLAMPSRDEGVPNTVQEAMAIGLPVAVGAAGGMPEIVTSGETGWVLNVDDPGEWAKRIQWCYAHRDYCKAIGQSASVYAFEHFGTEHWGMEYTRVIETLNMSRPHKGRK
ncbi:MAG: glycosyltransferase family 4 protein [Desulfohalobium sp.]